MNFQFQMREITSCSETLERDIKYLSTIEEAEKETSFPGFFKNLKHKILNEACAYIDCFIRAIEVDEELIPKVWSFYNDILKKSINTVIDVLIVKKDTDLFDQEISRMYNEVVKYVLSLEKGEYKAA